MAEILVRVVNKIQPDPIKAERLLRAGDVVSVCPDGWSWTTIERTNPEWRIISANILPTAVEALLAKAQNPLVPRRREWQVDFSLMPEPSLFLGVRTQDIIPLTAAQLLVAAVRKPTAIGNSILGNTPLGL